ncbi:hypothetical protein [Oscillibacter sp. CU971]|uniref:hypothetical protein n=1 Tax=Oscillibacter sp. CU971 TaxID=2780102 RepID=UPI001956072F|nr:hypothetical protein [Oscillibacter sp. CU971]
MSAEEKSRYFQELTLNLQHEGFIVKPETAEGLLPVELDDQRLCLALDTGAVRYWREDAADDRRKAALDKVVSITKTTAEYMHQIEAAPRLMVGSLTGDYRLLADFNGVVLAGHPTKYGIQFITWERMPERSSLNAGNYYGPSGGVDSYTAAKRNFAARSGLILRSDLFSPEQLVEVYRCVHEILDSSYPITEGRRKCLESTIEQIARSVPDLNERVEISNGEELEYVDALLTENSGMQFTS